MRAFFFFCLFSLVLSFQMTAAQALTIEKLRFGIHADKTRLVIELDEPTNYRTFMLPQIQDKPYRLVVDMPDFNWKAGAIKTPPNSKINDVRSGTLEKNIERLVIDLDAPAKILKAFTLPASGSSATRLVIDFTYISKQQFDQTPRTPIGSLPVKSDVLGDLIASQAQESSTKAQAPSSARAPVASAKDIITPGRKPSAPKVINSSPTPAKLSPLRRPLIVIDAGHGGADSGAVGAEKQYEKNITLAAAKALKAKLDKTGRYNVALTRSDDRYLKLYKRVSIARNKDADLFISLHADSIDKPNVQGASIYTLSNKASDAQTAKLARRENQADLIAGVDLSHEDKDVANILLDLAMRDTMNQSKFFANTVVNSMQQKGIRVLTRPHRYAGFAVLKAPDTPSVLFEMGFMSNRKEARLLSSSSYRDKIASALVDAIDSYFQKIEQNNQ